MDLRKLKTLIDLVAESGISELEVTEENDKVRIVNKVQTVAVAAPVAAAPVSVAAAPAAPAAPEAAPAPEPEKALTLEEVRAILAEKSRDGFTAQIRDLLLKYGAKKLSEVDPASYKALVADAEVLGNV